MLNTVISQKMYTIISRVAAKRKIQKPVQKKNSNRRDKVKKKKKKEKYLINLKKAEKEET